MFSFQRSIRPCGFDRPGASRAARPRPRTGGRPPTELPRRTYHVCHPRRSALRTAWNLLQSLRIVLRERPALVISSGADVAVPVCILARLTGA